MRTLTYLAAVTVFGVTAPLSAFAQDNQAVGVSGEELLAATATNAVGDPIAYPTGAAELSSSIVTFEKDGHTALHQHPVPIYVYILEGEVEVRVDGAEPIRMMPGQAFIEPQNRNMQAFNVADGPSKLLVVTMGAQGQPSSADPQ